MRLNPTVQFRVKLESKKKLLTKLVSPVSGQEVGHYNVDIRYQISALPMKAAGGRGGLWILIWRPEQARPGQARPRYDGC